MSITTEQVQGLSERASVYAGSDKVGGLGQVYLDDETGEPTWVTVKTGLFGTSESFVPLQGAEVRGDDLVVGFDEDTIKNAPRVEADGEITPDEEDRLYQYYGLSSAPDGLADAETDATSQTTGVTTDETEVRPAGDEATGAVAGEDVAGTSSAEEYDTSGPTTDDAMTRSEEQAVVGTKTREAGRARLRKYVTTETVSQTVPVRHEEVTLEREPITDANAGAAQTAPSISEEEHEVVLHEEVPVVEKEVVPVERVKLGTETVTEDATVSTDVRKEQVELADDTSTDATGTTATDPR